MNVNEKNLKIISSRDQIIMCSNGDEYMDISTHNFQDICRFCLFGPAEIDLFIVEYEKMPLVHICSSQFSIMIDSNDRLPKNICKKCENKVKDLITFKLSILEAENILKKALEMTNSLNYKMEEIDFISGNVSDGSENNFKSKEKNCKKETQKLNFYRCKYCKNTFKESLEYKRHLKEEQDKRKDLFSACIICKKLYTKRKLVTHMKIHTEIKEPQNFQCDTCGKNYRTKRNLGRHYLTHTGMPHVCESCGKGFREANLLKDHLNIHKGISPYPCNLCGKSYPTTSALRFHRTYTHTGKKRKIYKYPKKAEGLSIKKSIKDSFPCEICGKIYSSKTSVNYHVLTHSEEKKFQCNDCGKMFANRGILGDHRRIHRLSYKCTYCERSFAYAASLETHINSHTGEKPHGCTVCGKRYSNRSHLKEHMRNHTGERPYSCTICGKTFTVKGSLNTHLKTHTKTVS